MYSPGSLYLAPTRSRIGWPTGAIAIGNACLAYRAKYHQYPAELKDLVPEFLPSVPVAKWGDEHFGYSRALDPDRQPMLYYAAVPPFGRRFYHMERGDILIDVLKLSDNRAKPLVGVRDAIRIWQAANPSCQARCRVTDSRKSLMAFQLICTPMQTRRNDDNFVITIIAVRPRIRARRSANP